MMRCVRNGLFRLSALDSVNRFFAELACKSFRINDLEQVDVAGCYRLTQVTLIRLTRPAKKQVQQKIDKSLISNDFCQPKIGLAGQVSAVR
jgi:hypothetical protein